jgi:arylsulfatase A-like enzyme
VRPLARFEPFSGSYLAHLDGMKRVLLIVVDGCSARILGPAIASGQLPTLANLASRGSLDLECVSIFPSITPAATASLVTGHYPDRHGIIGMSWWNASTGEVSYFGDDVWTIAKQGFGEFLCGFLLKLNGERLQSPTMFQVVESQQRRAASFNYLIFKGDVPHEISVPLLLRLLPSVQSSLTVHGPASMCLGDFVSTSDSVHDLETSGGLFHRFGLDDHGTEAFLKSLPDASALPDYSVAYFADNDYDSHDKGPQGALGTLERLDRRLAAVFDAWGGLDRVLEETSIVLTADHAHSDVRDDTTGSIELNEVLKGFKCGTPADGWRDEDELLLCPNLRAAEVYIHAAHDCLDVVRRRLLEDTRIDQVIWRDAASEGEEFGVATGDRGTLRFRRARNAEAGVLQDEYGGRWQVSGDDTALDLRRDGTRVEYGAYPNALERIAAGVDHPRAGRVWVTARPGYEFRVQGQHVHHGGGSHGSLHELDSVVPLLIAGQEMRRTSDRRPRIVDVAPLCAAHIGVTVDTTEGEAR